MFIKQSETNAARRVIYFTAVNTDDSAYTSTLTGADIRISKAGGAEANSAGTATHIATGLFKYEFTAAEVDTLGEMSVRLAKTGVYNDIRVVNVVAFDPYSSTNLGLANLDAVLSTRLAASAYTSPETILTFSNGVETGITVQQALRLMAAVLGGRVSGSGTGVEVFRSANDTKNRVTATIDTSGNRTNITTDLT